MRANGAYTCLVSGGFTLFTDAIAAMIGFDENRANTLLIDGGKLAGLVAEPILGREAKLADPASNCASASACAGARRWRSATAPTTSP